jgi:hypothetical protein
MIRASSVSGKYEGKFSADRRCKNVATSSSGEIANSTNNQIKEK